MSDMSEIGLSRQNSACSSRDAEEMLNLFTDGELPSSRQALFFGHLSNCEECRRNLDAIMRFRLATRQENLSVPPSLDTAFMKRLAGHRKQARVDRHAEHQPFGISRRKVSLRAAVGAGVAVAVFLLVFAVPDSGHVGMAERETLVVQGEELTVMPAAGALPAPAVYVFFPGLTVEAEVERPAPRDAME